MVLGRGLKQFVLYDRTWCDQYSKKYDQGQENGKYYPDPAVISLQINPHDDRCLAFLQRCHNQGQRAAVAGNKIKRIMIEAPCIWLSIRSTERKTNQMAKRMPIDTYIKAIHCNQTVTSIMDEGKDSGSYSPVQIRDLRR